MRPKWEGGGGRLGFGRNRPLGFERSLVSPGHFDAAEGNYKVRSPPGRTRPARFGTSQLGSALSSRARCAGVRPSPCSERPTPPGVRATHPSDLEPGLPTPFSVSPVVLSAPDRHRKELRYRSLRVSIGGLRGEFWGGGQLLR